MKNLLKELKEAKKSHISSWIDEVSYKIDKLDEFFVLANSLGLVKGGNYISGIPTGNSKDVRRFYLLEDQLNYPQPQKVK